VMRMTFLGGGSSTSEDSERSRPSANNRFFGFRSFNEGA
jgi:hypothetical protein